MAVPNSRIQKNNTQRGVTSDLLSTRAVRAIRAAKATIMEAKAAIRAARAARARARAIRAAVRTVGTPLEFTGLGSYWPRLSLGS